MSGWQDRKSDEGFFSACLTIAFLEQEVIMAREWSLQTVTNLKFRELEKTLIEIFGCIPVDYKRVIKLDIRRGTPMVQVEPNLGMQEKSIVEIFGCMPSDKHVIEFDVDRKKKIVVKVVRADSEFLKHSAPCA